MRPVVVVSWIVSLAALLLPVAGCGGNSGGLHGSICSGNERCKYDTVSIRNVSDPKETITTIQIDYTVGPLASATSYTTVVCDVSNFTKGEPVPASSVRHVGANDADVFPTYYPGDGTCTIDTDLVVGGDISGSFQAVFTTETGTKRALYGDFDGTLEDAGGL
jgi:hypothetical protein